MSTLIDSDETSTEVSHVSTSMPLVDWFTIRENQVIGHRGTKSKLENIQKYSKETIFLSETEAYKALETKKKNSANTSY